MPQAFPFAILSIVNAGLALSVQAPASNLTERRLDYVNALRDWDQSDSNLERDLFRLPSTDILQRIDSVEKKRQSLDLARSRYTEALSATIKEQVRLLRSQNPLTADQIKAIQQQQGDDARTTVASLDASIRRIKLSERAAGEDLHLRRSEAQNIYDAILRHQDDLANDSTASTLARARTVAISDALAMERVAATPPQDWSRAYAAMREEVQKRAGLPDRAAASGGPASAPAPTQLVLPSLAGAWVYSNPEAKKVGDIYQWTSARADIVQEGDSIWGDYQCTYAVPSAEKLNPKVQFSFYGKITSEVMQFELKPPMKGWLRILKTSASEITISYFVENSKQVKISFGAVADNDPQTLSRLVK